MTAGRRWWRWRGRLRPASREVREVIRRVNIGGAPIFLVVLVALLAVLVIGDPGRIDRSSTWLRVMTGTLIGLISAVNATAAARLVAGIIGAEKFSTDANVLLASGGAIWLSNVIIFGLWYWDLDRGGAAAVIA